MKVKFDVSEVEWGTWYKDEKCKEVERALRSDPRYAECEVKRARWEDESNDDPFCVLDEKGEDIITLYRWEVCALSGSEFLSYIDIQRIRNRASSRLEQVRLSFIVASACAVATAIAAGVFFYSGDYEPFSFSIGLIVLASILSFFVGILYYSMHKSTALRMKNVDLEVVREDGSFLDMLRKLAEVPDANQLSKKQLLERVKDIEGALTGINS